MANGADEWFSLQTVRELGAGMVIGALGVLSLIKRGWIFVGGDKIELLNRATNAEKAAAVAEAKLASAVQDISERDAIIADLRRSPPKE